MGVVSSGRIVMAKGTWRVEVDLTEPVEAIWQIDITQNSKVNSEKSALSAARKLLRAQGYEWKPNKDNSNWRVHEP